MVYCRIDQNKTDNRENQKNNKNPFQETSLRSLMKGMITVNPPIHQRYTTEKQKLEKKSLSREPKLKKRS